MPSQVQHEVEGKVYSMGSITCGPPQDAMRPPIWHGSKKTMAINWTKAAGEVVAIVREQLAGLGVELDAQGQAELDDTWGRLERYGRALEVGDENAQRILDHAGVEMHMIVARYSIVKTRGLAKRAQKTVELVAKVAFKVLLAAL